MLAFVCIITCGLCLSACGSTNFMDLRDKESIKIQCGKKHFQAIGADVCFDVTKTFRDFKGKHL